MTWNYQVMDAATAANWLARHRRRFQLKLSDRWERDGHRVRSFHAGAGKVFADILTKRETSILDIEISE